MGEHLLWFDAPATHWNEALPLGNGTLGAMVYGRTDRETFSLNDGAAWSGSPESEHAEPRIAPAVAAAALAEARAAIARGDYAASDAALRRIQHRYSQTFLPFADLHVGLECGPGEYRRSLDLATATHETRTGDNVVSSYVSHAFQVLVIELGTRSLRSLDISTQLRVLDERSAGDTRTLLLRLPSDVAPNHDPSPSPVTYADGAPSLEGAVVARIVRERSREWVVVATATTFDGIGRMPVGTAEDAQRAAVGRVDAAVAAGIDVIRARHLADHGELYARVDIVTGPPSDLPTNERFVGRGGRVLDRDPGLAGLLFNYGRYLLISSSRAGGLPATLQGLWNDSMQPAWSSNYTTNINLEMNYWLAEVGNLPECLPPLFDLIDALAITGAATARQLYDAPGWVAHHNSDAWAYSQPVGLGDHDPKWAFWPLAGAWLCRHYRDRIDHGADLAFIRDRVWAPVRSATEFYLGWLVEQPDGSLGTSPSTSPENQFTDHSGRPASSAASSTNDLVAIADLFDLLALAAARLGRGDDPVVRAASAARGRIGGVGIGRGGAVKEWSQDFEFPDPHHRHLSHLYFLHPAGWPVDEDLRRAAVRSLDARGDESTGWSLAWKLIMRARLGQADNVSDLLGLIFRDMTVDRGPWVGGLYPNLFSAHPPFAIDGNLGYVTGLAECLVQSHRGVIEVLPALPAELAEGTVSGLVVRPGLELSVAWSGGRLSTVQLHAPADWSGGIVTVRYRGVDVTVDLDAGEQFEIGVAAFETKISVPLEAARSGST